MCPVLTKARKFCFHSVCCTSLQMLWCYKSVTMQDSQVSWLGPPPSSICSAKTWTTFTCDVNFSERLIRWNQGSDCCADCCCRWLLLLDLPVSKMKCMSHSTWQTVCKRGKPYNAVEGHSGQWRFASSAHFYKTNRWIRSAKISP